MWAALEADRQLSAAELRRRAYGSFATAWNGTVRYDAKEVPGEETGCVAGGSGADAVPGSRGPQSPSRSAPEPGVDAETSGVVCGEMHANAEQTEILRQIRALKHRPEPTCIARDVGRDYEAAWHMNRERDQQQERPEKSRADLQAIAHQDRKASEQQHDTAQPRGQHRVSNPGWHEMQNQLVVDQMLAPEAQKNRRKQAAKYQVAHVLVNPLLQIPSEAKHPSSLRLRRGRCHAEPRSFALHIVGTLGMHEAI
jgi:hypothetical protein